MATDGITPTYSGLLTLDVPDYALNQPGWFKDLIYHEVTGGQDIEALGGSNVLFIPRIGYQLKTEHDTMQAVHEEASIDPLVQPATPSGFFQKYINSPSALTGVPTGSQVQGDSFYQKSVNSADHWDGSAYQSSSDYSSFPPPSETEIVPLDRVIVGAHPASPDQFVACRFRVPDMGSAATKGALLRLYFTSVPTAILNGIGLYALTLFGDSNAYLWEKITTGGWTLRKRFDWTKGQQVGQHWHLLVIRSDAYHGDDGFYKGSVINIHTQKDDSFDIAHLAQILGVFVGGGENQYIIAGGQQNTTAVSPQPVRLDIRRDVRATVQASFTAFKPTGTLVTQAVECPWTLGAVGSADNPIVVTVLGSFASGSSVSIALKDGTGAACTASGTQYGTTTSQSRAFTRNAGQTRYQATITLNASSDKSKSPTITRCLFVRNGAVSLNQVTPVAVKWLETASVIGAGPDMTTETATFEIKDLESYITPLQTRSAMSIRYEMNCPTTENPTQTSTIFLGKVRRAKKHREGPAPNGEGWPASDWGHYILSCEGFWSRLAQGKTSQTFFLGSDPATGPNHGQPYKVTDAVYILLSNLGLSPSMIDIPDSPIRFLYTGASDTSDAFRIEAYTPILPVASGFVSDYLAGFLTFDANATNGGGSTDKFGCVRLRYCQRPDLMGNYAVVAAFATATNWTDVIRSVFNLNSYSSTTVNGVSVPTIPIKRFSIEEWNEPPEGNGVIVTGTAAAPQSGGSGLQSGLASLTRTLYNYPAAEFYAGQPIAANPAYEDYTDGSPNYIVLVDPDLTTQQAVDVAARRIFDRSMHTRKYMSFEAPLALITDPNDALQIRPRPLKFGDCVYYNNDYWWVSSCTPDIAGIRGGSRCAMAVYELFQVPGLSKPSHNPCYQAGQHYAPLLPDK